MSQLSGLLVLTLVIAGALAGVFQAYDFLVSCFQSFQKLNYVTVGLTTVGLLLSYQQVLVCKRGARQQWAEAYFYNKEATLRLLVRLVLVTGFLGSFYLITSQPEMHGMVFGPVLVGGICFTLLSVAASLVEKVHHRMVLSLPRNPGLEGVHEMTPSEVRSSVVPGKKEPTLG